MRKNEESYLMAAKFELGVGKRFSRWTVAMVHNKVNILNTANGTLRNG